MHTDRLISPAPRRWPVRLLGLAAVLFFLGLVARFWHPVWGLTAFIQLDASYDSKKIAEFHTQPVYVFQDSGPYDGIAYSQIAYHPLLRAPELRGAVDNLSYRGRRILPPALAWILAGGNPRRIIQVYVLLNVFAWLILAALLWRLLAVEDFRSWLAWAGLLFSAGALASVRQSLTDLIALTFLAAAMAALESRRPGRAFAWLAAAGLSRETLLGALPGLWTAPWFSWTNARRTLIAVLPLLLWLLYIRRLLGPADSGWGNFTWPAAGFIEKWRASLADLAHPQLPLLAWTTLLATLGLTVQAAYLLIRPRFSDPWWRIGAVYAVMLLGLGTAVWEGYPGAVQRVLLPLSLAFFVLARRRRAALAWILAGSLTACAGLPPLLDVPTDGREIAAARQGDDACLVHVGAGWHGCEHTSRHIWAWSDGSGPSQLDLTVWPQTDLTWRMDLFLRSPVPRTVVIRQDGAELWRGEVGPAKLPVSFSFHAAGGSAALEFSSPTPALRENAHPDARLIAFGIYDPKVQVTDRP
jgi:hypothetical protein